MTPALHPRGALRSSPIRSVTLTSGEVDAIAGLLTLRERQAFDLHAPEKILAVLAENPIFNVLDPEFVTRRRLDGGDSVSLSGGLQLSLFPVPGKVPLFLEDRAQALLAEDEVWGAEVTDGRARLLFIPACAMLTDALRAHITDADLLFFDGTLWEDDEMIKAGLGPKTGRRMGHMALQGAEGTLAAFSEVPVTRKVLIHINNSNPILDRSAPEHAAVRAAGWDVAFDGMEITL